jgi:hypothetical protein
LKKVSVTTAVPRALGGLIKNAVKAEQAAMDAYPGLLAEPTLLARLQINESRKMDRRPKRLDKGAQNRGAPPRIAIWRATRYETRCKLTPKSSEIMENAGTMEAAVKGPIIAWKARKTRFTVF